MTNFHLVKMNPILEFLKTLDNITNSAYWGEFSHCGSYDLISQALITKPWTGGMGWEVIGEHFGQNLLTSSFNWVLLFHVDHYHEVSMLMVELLGTGGAWDRWWISCVGLWWYLVCFFLVLVYLISQFRELIHRVSLWPWDLFLIILDSHSHVLVS
jgi:hypothetical protein